MNWNIYVLLLFRRYDLIDIIDITNDNGIYIFSIEIKNDLLRNESVERTALLERIRKEEWDYYNNAYLTMEKAIDHSDYECWSEMFFDTYDKVFEYCAGCNAHKNRDNGDEQVFPLKKNIKEPILTAGLDQKLLFESQSELVVYAQSAEKAMVIDYLEKHRLTCLIATELQIQKIGYFENVSSGKTTYIVSPSEMKELLKKNNYYYISGMVAVLYPEEENEILKVYESVAQYLCKKSGIYVVHILNENTYLTELGKNIADLIEGRVVNAATLCSSSR